MLDGEGDRPPPSPPGSLAMSDARPPLSPRKLAANRAKARKSTGPRTAAGKAASACNAYQHGLTGESLALPPDLADAVQAKEAAYEATLRPRNEVERDLARAMHDHAERRAAAVIELAGRLPGKTQQRNILFHRMS